MQLSPREKDKLLIAMAAEVARKRKSRGVKLNYPEAISLICDAVVEGARDGKSVAEMMEYGATIVKSTDCMDGVPDMIPEVQVEATFFVSNTTCAINIKVFHFHETGASLYYITAGIIFAVLIFIFLKVARSS